MKSIFGICENHKDSVEKLFKFLTYHIDLIVKQDGNGDILFDLNTRMKYPVYMCFSDDKAVVRAKHSSANEISLDQPYEGIALEIANIVKDCIGNKSIEDLEAEENGWLAIFKHFGMIKVVSKMDWV